MIARRLRIPGLVLALLALVTAACGSGPTGGRDGSGELVIFAAASLKSPLERAAGTYEAGHPGQSIRLAFDSSAALRTQIEQGAPADLFLSADLSNPEKLETAGLGGGPVTPFAGNAVVIVTPLANPAGLETAFDLAADGVAIVAAGEDVPITAYAHQLVALIGARPDAPPGFAARYERNIVSREDNVRAVAAKLELGEGDAGIVYRTDAIGSNKLATIVLPDGVGVAVSYGGIVVAHSGHVSDASSFLSWLAGAEGQAVLAGFGFVPVS